MNRLCHVILACVRTNLFPKAREKALGTRLALRLVPPTGITTFQPKALENLFYIERLLAKLSEKSFVLLARPLRGLTYSTLKFMRSACGKSNF